MRITHPVNHARSEGDSDFPLWPHTAQPEVIVLITRFLPGPLRFCHMARVPIEVLAALPSDSGREHYGLLLARIAHGDGDRMVRSELLAALVRENPGLSPDEVSRLIDTFFDAISGQLAQGGRVELRGFGVFTTKERAATLARNPFTGDRFLAPGRNVAHFKPALAMGRRLNPEKSHQTTPDTGDT